MVNISLIFYYAILSVATYTSAAPWPHPDSAAPVVTPLNARPPLNFLEDIRDELEPHSAEITQVCKVQQET